MGLGGFSGLINGLIAADFGALSMLMSEPTAKSNVKRTCMFVLSIATLLTYLLTYFFFEGTFFILFLLRSGTLSSRWGGGGGLPCERN